MRLLIAAKDYSSAIAEAGYILKENEDDLEALLLRGRAYYYLGDHDVATRCVSIHARFSSHCHSDACGQ